MSRITNLIEEVIKLIDNLDIIKDKVIGNKNKSRSLVNRIKRITIPLNSYKNKESAHNNEMIQDLIDYLNEVQVFLINVSLKYNTI